MSGICLAMYIVCVCVGVDVDVRTYTYVLHTMNRLKQDAQENVFTVFNLKTKVNCA